MNKITTIPSGALHLKLLRLNLSFDGTEGDLWIENENRMFCNTLEDRVRDLNADGDLQDEGEEKVYGETAIPYGIYKISATWSPKFQMAMVQILDVPEFTGIRFHWAVDTDHLEGCVGIGERLGEYQLYDTNKTRELVELVRDKYNNNAYLEIV